MRARIAGALVAAWVGACGGGGSSNPQVKEMQAVADEMCKCKSGECFAKVIEAHAKLLEPLKGSDPKQWGKELSEKDRTAFVAAARRAEECAKDTSGM